MSFSNSHFSNSLSSLGLLGVPFLEFLAHLSYPLWVDFSLSSKLHAFFCPVALGYTLYIVVACLIQ